MTTQTKMERDYAHIMSTRDLLLEMFEAQNIDNGIAIVSMFAATMRIQAKRSSNMGQFMDKMDDTLKRMDDAVASHILQMMNEAFKSEDKSPSRTNDKFINALAWLRSGPESIKLENGKIVITRSS